MSILDLPDGLHPNVDPATYHARIPGVASKSVLDIVGRSAAHYKLWLDGAEEEPTDAMLLGSALHCAVLEPERFSREYAVQPDFGDGRTTAAKAKKAAWQADFGDGRIALKPADGVAIAGMVASIRKHPKAGPMLAGGQTEITMLWTDEETGIRCKGRADCYAPHYRVIIDVKTCEDARAEAFAKSIANRAYHKQDVFYTDGFTALGHGVDAFLFLAVEKTAPFNVKLHMLDDDARKRGARAVRRDMQALAACVETLEFAGYDPEINIISLPPWAA